MARIKSKAKGAGGVGFNMVPMIDLVFQLLIFLLVTRHFVEMTTVELTLPPAAKAENKMDELTKYKQVVVNIVPPKAPSKTTQVIIDTNVLMESVEGGDVPNPDKLIAYLKEKQALAAIEKRNPRPVNVILRAGEDVPYEIVGRVMIATSMAGIKYWWVQAYMPRTPTVDDQNRRKFLGVPAMLGGR
jgi:biopolymer transport protein ExbD